MRIPVLLVSSLALVAVAPHPGRAGIVLPGDPVAGVAQDELAVRWTQWAFSFPDGANPLQDATGALSHLGDQGAYFFLAGTFGDIAGPVTRTATIRSNQSLFFPLMNATSPAPFFGNTPDELRQDAADTIGVVSDLTLTLDGVSLPLPPPTTSLLDYRQETPPETFDLTFPANAVFGVPEGTYQAVGVGYWIGLTPLARGNYQLHFTARSVGTGAYDGVVYTQDMTYNLSVVPEPSALAMLATGIVAALGCARRRQPAPAGPFSN